MTFPAVNGGGKNAKIRTAQKKSFRVHTSIEEEKRGREQEKKEIFE